MRGRSWGRFLEGVQEVRLLLEQAEGAPKILMTGSRYSKEQVYVRAAIVLLTAHIEGFYKKIADDFSDVIGESWEELLPGSKRYMLVTAWRRLVDELEPAANRNFTETKKFNEHRKAIVQVSKWFTRPATFANSGYRSRVEGFYRLNGSAALLSYTSDFSGDGSSVFDTIKRNGLDRGAFWTVVEGLVAARNEIAHGNDVSLTLQDLRKYLATCIVLVRQSLRHFGVAMK